MAEYIEREAVMQEFADRVRQSNNSDFASAPTWNQAVQIVEDFPAADVQPVRWIPVTERMPMERTDVLAMTADCDIYVCDFIPSVKQFWTIPGDNLHIDDISHWMPLPQIPKGEE